MKISIDNRPRDYEYALLSQHVYRGSTLKKGDCLPGDEKWKIYQIKKGESDYFGAIYINDEIQQVVLAHRGTDSLGAILEDMRGVFFNRISPYKKEVFNFVADAINLVRCKQGYRLSFTGHSLGAFLAELSVFYVHSHFNLPDVNAVTFESPGSKESLERMQSNLDSIILEQLDIVGYVSYPNLINTCNKHVGTLYHIEPNLRKIGWVHGWYTKNAHSINGIIQLFQEEVNNMPMRHCMSDWPLGSQEKIYFEHAKFHEREYNLIEESMKQEEERVKNIDVFSLTYKGYRRREVSSYHVLALRHFSSSMQTFLREFYQRISHIAPDENMSKLLTERWQENKIPENIIKYLQSYRVEKDISGIEKIVLEDSADVHYFRREVSNWLQKSGHNIDKLIDVKVTSPAKRLLEQWNVPPKNSNFIGRSKLLKQLEDHFGQRTTPAILKACHGLGGIGKTQVASEFVWQHYKKFNGVVWFNAESIDRLQNDYNSLGRELNIIGDDSINAEELARHVKHWFEDPSHAGWLLVYDNADNYKAISELLPTKGGKILITSRHSANWPQEISIDVFTIEESRAYIQKVLDTPISESEIETLSETLGRLPLALAQATAYIKYTKISISLYLELYKEKKLDLLNSKIFPSDCPSSVFITWDITMKAIRKESLLTERILNICACLSSNNIPNFLLEKFANTIEKNPNSEIFEALRKLNHYSMLGINEQNYSSSIHRLVQEVIRINWGEERTHNLMEIFNLLMDSFPYNGETMADYIKKRRLLPHLEAFLPHLDAWQQEEQQLRKDREKGFLRPLLIDIGDWCRSVGTAEKEREKDYLLPLLNYIVDGYDSLGNAEKKRELLERVLAIEERHYGLDHPNVAITLTNLGSAYGDLGYTQKKCEFLGRALAIKERHYGLDHPSVATILADLGGAYYSLDDTQKSRYLLERALAIEERHYGLDHPNVAIILTNLGNAFGALGDAQKKRELLERALAIEERHYGLDHPNVAMTLTNLSSAFGALGDAQKKRELLERALAIKERHYGPDHQNVAFTLANLGSAFGSLGDTHKKRELLERTLAINERHYGLDHPNVAITLTNLGNAYGDLGDFKKSRELLEQALAIKERHYGPDHPGVAITLANLGCAFGALGDTLKKRELLERALAIKERHYGLDHLNVAATLTNLGNAYRDLGDSQKSRELLERALSIKERHYGPNHPEVAITLDSLGNAYVKLGDSQKSRELLERALAIEERNYGPDHPGVAITLANLGCAFGALGDSQKSRELLERALPIKERYYGPDHPEVAITLTNLGDAYTKLGDSQKSRELLERALLIKERHYGPDHPEVAITLTNLGGAYRMLGFTQKSREFLERALAINERHYGPNHPEVATRLTDLGNAFGALSDTQKKTRVSITGIGNQGKTFWYLTI
jgi:tetratricopeptide (TPR) repeat protein